MKVTITIGAGLGISVVPWKHLRSALLAAEDTDMPLEGNLGTAADTLALELRGFGHEVDIAIQPGYSLVHVCGETWDPTAWKSLSAKRFDSQTASLRDSYFELRQCTCGSHIAYSSLLLMAGEDA